MKKTIAFLLACILCAAFAFAACAEVTQAEVEELIIGKWMLADKNGRPALTNEKMVITVESTDKAFLSTSRFGEKGMKSIWHHQMEAEVTIDSHTVTVTRIANVEQASVQEFNVTKISNREFLANRKWTRTNKGEEPQTLHDILRFVKITDDFSDDIIGTWEGRCTSEGSVFDDGQEHRWEYKADGTFVYYVKDGENWVPAKDELNEYFVDGILHCTRWVENGEESREWWEIAIDGDRMNWTALRTDENGNGFTATFEMTKVHE